MLNKLKNNKQVKTIILIKVMKRSNRSKQYFIKDKLSYLFRESIIFIRIITIGKYHG